MLKHVLGISLIAFALARPSAAAAPPAPVTPDEARAIAVEAYTYAYPLVLMDTTRHVMTNTVTPDPEHTCAPVNQFCNVRTFPDASFTAVVRPNADTLYSSLWFDVSKEPLVISVPDSHDRYYLLPMLDLWTDIFASPGKRTTGTGPQTFAIVSPTWQGQLPDGVEMYRATTPTGWMIGRTQTNGPDDYDNVHKFQDGLKAVPLSSYGKEYTPPKGVVDPAISKEAPSEQVAKMDAATFFKRFSELTKDTPPHANDYPILDRMRRIGLVPGQPFDLAAAPPDVQAACNDAVATAPQRFKEFLPRSAKIVNGWIMSTNPIGTYGTAYLNRALIAYAGLGANVVEDALYPTADAQPNGQPFDSDKRYILHFTKDQIPPINGFWSLTMYNEKQFFAANPINRYAIGNRNKLQFGPDGSLTLFIQRNAPGQGKDDNWLPAPAAGPFTMNLRLYWPKQSALDGTWSPPAVRESGTAAPAQPAEPLPAAGQIKPPQ